ncbi:hypothetical protein FQR65_LT18941 [Abscondita terminalis]|nr:hypothetical protein FQR65_LT18941 [Abscondita terminalis]
MWGPSKLALRTLAPSSFPPGSFSGPGLLNLLLASAGVTSVKLQHYTRQPSISPSISETFSTQSPSTSSSLQYSKQVSKPSCSYIQTQDNNATASNNDDTTVKVLKKIQREMVAQSLVMRGILERIANIENIVSKNETSQEKTVNNNEEEEKLFKNCFPVTTVAEMNEVNKLLKENNNFYLYVVRRSKLLLGNNTKNSIINILKFFIRNSVASQYSWFGAKKKLIFSSLQLVKVTKDTIRSQKGQEITTDDEIADVVKNWLRLGKLRLDRESAKDGN